MYRKLLCSITLLAAAAMVQPATAQARAAEKAQAVKITDGPRVEGTGDSWAVIAWTTNTGGSSVIRYGTDRNSLSQTAEAPYADNEKTKGQNHRVHIKGLRPGTTYYFMADSGQGEDTGTEAKSSVQQFTTKGAGAGTPMAKGGDADDHGRAQAVKITDGPRVEGTTRDMATIAWTTNTGGSTIVRYGENKNSLTQMAEAPYADNEKTHGQNHRVQIKHLKPGTTYYFIADSGQGEGTGTEAKSSVQEFTTKK